MAADFGGDVRVVGNGVEASDRPRVAGVELANLAHQLGVGRDDVAAAVGVNRLLDGVVAAERNQIGLEEPNRHVKSAVCRRDE